MASLTTDTTNNIVFCWTRIPITNGLIMTVMTLATISVKIRKCLTISNFPLVLLLFSQSLLSYEPPYYVHVYRIFPVSVLFLDLLFVQTSHGLCLFLSNLKFWQKFEVRFKYFCIWYNRILVIQKLSVFRNFNVMQQNTRILFELIFLWTHE